MKYVTDFILDLDLPKDLKEELTADDLVRKHHFYLQLATFLQPAFAAVAGEQVQKVTVCGYLYFRFLLAIDALLDANSNGQQSQLVRRLFGYLKVHEQAIVSLAQLFPAADAFWVHFEACKQEYAKANLLEKQISSARSVYSQELFEQIAAGKSAVCYTMAYALAGLAQETVPIQPIKKCLQHLHIAMQCLDDLDDFKADFLAGQFTMPIFWWSSI